LDPPSPLPVLLPSDLLNILLYGDKKMIKNRCLPLRPSLLPTFYLPFSLRRWLLDIHPIFEEETASVEFKIAETVLRERFSPELP